MDRHLMRMMLRLRLLYSLRSASMVVDISITLYFLSIRCVLLTPKLFWENLTPAKSYEEPSGPLAKAIDSKYGSLDKLQTTFNGALAGIQGSGWGWLVKKDGELQIVTTPVRIGEILKLRIESRSSD